MRAGTPACAYRCRLIPSKKPIPASDVGMEGTAIMNLRERQQPLKERYRQDPESALLVHSVHSRPLPDDPTRAEITNGTQSWVVSAHAMAGGNEGMACSGDVLLAAL